MGERGKKKDKRRDAPKKTDLLPPLLLPRDQALATKQRNFCKNIIQLLLEDEAAISFSKPVDELWDRDVLADYFEIIKEPMDLGTVLDTVSSDNGYITSETGLFDPNAFRLKARLVFLNALEYNSKGTDLVRYANRFLNVLDARMSDLPLPPPSQNDHAADSPSNPRIPHSHRKRAKEETRVTKREQTEDQNGDVDADVDMRETAAEDQEAEKLRSHIAALQKKKAVSEAALAEIELVRNVPLSFEENSKLRDEVESLPWEKAQRVAKILESYVQDALRESKEEDPEFVTLEFSTVEPRLLRDIEALIRPDPRVEKERNAIATLDEELSSAKRKLKGLEQGGRKKPRRRR